MEIYKLMTLKFSEREKLAIATAHNAVTGDTIEGYNACRLKVEDAVSALEGPGGERLEGRLAEVVPGILEKLKKV